MRLFYFIIIIFFMTVYSDALFLINEGVGKRYMCVCVRVVHTLLLFTKFEPLGILVIIW